MPALLLHLTLAEETARDADPGGLLAVAARSAPGPFALGSILPDLPYHAHFAQQTVRHLLRRSYLPSEWGDLHHSRRTGRFALALAAHVRRSILPPDRHPQALALLAGYLSHYALDTVVHPVINRLAAKRATRVSRPPDAIHAEIERLQSLFYHHDRLGYDISGTPHARHLIGRVEGATPLWPRLSAPVGHALRAAWLQTHARLPKREQLRDWLRGVGTYGLLFSSPLGRRVEGLKGDLTALREESYLGPVVDLASPLQEAKARTYRHWIRAEALVTASQPGTEARALFLSDIPDVDLGTGACT